MASYPAEFSFQYRDTMLNVTLLESLLYGMLLLIRNGIRADLGRFGLGMYATVVAFTIWIVGAARSVGRYTRS